MITHLYIIMLCIGITLIISMVSGLFCVWKYMVDDIKICKYISIILFSIFIIALIFLIINGIELRLEYLKFFMEA